MGEQRQNVRRSLKRPNLGKNEQYSVEEKDHRVPLQPVRPTTDDRTAWGAYWQGQNQPWRTEPEISLERQAKLERCRALVPDIEKSIYPFKGMKLDRADVEWLLATHDGGPVKWSDEKERGREGLDVRGADMQQADLHQLPLTRLRGGLTLHEYLEATEEQRSSAVVLMRGLNLIEAQLEGANLSGAQLKGVNLSGAQLEGVNLSGAQLGGASLFRAQLGGADLSEAQLKGADLRNVILGDKQRIGPRLADLQWGDTNLAVVDWSQVAVLGDEREARQKRTPAGEKKVKAEQLSGYQTAVRANRQLAVALQTQGLHEEAARFAYRAQRLQRIVLRRQRKLVAYLFSGILDLIAGYGYRPKRSVIAYLVIILGFTGLYLLNAHFVASHLRWDEALVLSVSSFHGRGFFSQDISLGDTYARLAAAEAVVGLLIEISFIATFTQRFFGK